MQTTSAIRCSHSCGPAACDPRGVRIAPATIVPALLYGHTRMQRVIEAFAAHLEAMVDLACARVLAAGIPFYRALPPALAKLMIHRAFEAFHADLGRDETGVAMAVFDRDELRRYRANWGFFRDRRPELYGSLIK